ncbi:5-oxoprolinase/urea amidolyase family protein [Streptomyces caniscabiei]|uniref:5-oxoprolinase/urea amidolyase family protein n=1 Tax=Streptomyces caniscabiei TaxID=2746961 RepID=UPI0029B18008|nr:5-oxoprolinase/urea amidolyase family protein [Streptomyces caniscabiei]MDX2603357.1 5-oxoprolinase/urea amidolyase family protein [Streptomyces caniscabiei]MDX2740433.1 5-oxoprolinase/urea amidolyase family protein [Streptomyces caniscabiei]
MTFDTLLVANRGEIAVRIIRTARELGLRTVAVYSDADRAAAHVRLADEAVRLGPAPAKESYLDADLILKAAKDTGAGAVHPGYGFLSEDADFARRCEEADLVFVGPTADQLELFGAKHTARAAAEAAGVPLLPGTDLLDSLDEALAHAAAIGYPVMLKASGGGGGIGMSACRSAGELTEAWDRVRRVAAASFATASSSGVYLERLVERARHVEVQVFGDGDGLVVTFGDRDCTLQRRNQKVVEEAPAPGLPDHVRARLSAAARDLCASVEYRSAGTVEFVYDATREEAYFLEVNTRLQVEHPVTEEIYGVDLVAWMLRLARGDAAVVRAPGPPRGHAVEARLYAEDPSRGHRPSAGLLTRVEFPPGVRVDGWAETGTEVTTSYDPLLAKIVAYGSDRAHALRRLDEALARTRVDGIETNLGQLRAALADPDVRRATHSTATLAAVTDPTRRIEVLSGGTLTTVQDWPGRTGHWQVGVPPSGPMDDLSFRLGNRALGNPEGAPGLECTLQGPSLRFTHATTVCVTGAPAPVTVDGTPIAHWEPVEVPAGAVLSVGAPTEHGLRTYVLVAGGGLDVPSFLGSAATFTLGRFGGHGGRALRTGDVLHGGEVTDRTAPVPPEDRPAFPAAWRVAVLEGPHAAPEFFTEEDIHEFYAADWTVHFNSARTGVRLVGPKPRWARADGGEAGLHPSNIHDTPYSVGAVDYTGDMPVLLGPDGPSLGGFVCPATVVSTERWKLGQLRPGDTVRFVPVADDTSPRPAIVDGGVLARDGDVTYRRSGDDNLLVEFGPMRLDLALRMRVHALMEAVAEAGLHGVADLTPGIRSLQIRIDPALLPQPELLTAVRRIVASLPRTDELVVPSRTIHLPLSWDDPATREAIARYMAGVRDDAPWCPWNIEFIRRVNGLDTVADVHDTVFAAEYLVLGLGDVYLGAPVATPLDPRHRLVTTKYNPARTWTAENSVGIGGAYLCVYGMEGPGGYQFVGRTTQVWSPWQQRGAFEPGSPWLLRFFDRIRWYPVDADELLALRADIVSGRFVPRVEEGTFSLAAYETFLTEHADSIAEFRTRQQTAFAAERAAWEAAGEFDRAETGTGAAEPVPSAEVHVPEGAHLIEAEFTASVWQVNVRPGDRVTTGQPLLTLEAMKMESRVCSPTAGVIDRILTVPGTQVAPGTPLIILTPDNT